MSANNLLCVCLVLNRLRTAHDDWSAWVTRSNFDVLEGSICLELKGTNEMEEFASRILLESKAFLVDFSVLYNLGESAVLMSLDFSCQTKPERRQ